MSFFEAILQGIVQGLTEFLPISSSGHLSIVRFFTGVNLEEGNVFTVLLHFGTLIAVFIAFRKTILRLIFEFCSAQITETS
jgi:undecaprenyl-diphosphatase